MTSPSSSETTADTDLHHFIERYHDALIHQSSGDSAPLLSLWSQATDVAFMSPMGGYQLGHEQVSGLLAAAATTNSFQNWHVDNVVTVVNGDSAHTVEIEHGTPTPDPTGGSDWPAELALRVTTIYRRENGEWRLVLRHANVYQELDFPPYTARAAS